MKKVFLQIVICATLFSCSKKETGTTNELMTTDSDCQCSELNLLKTDQNGNQSEEWKNVMKDGKLYTGNCIVKDQNDTIIRRLEVKNGWVTREIKKENVTGNIYTITSDMHYKQLQKDNGYSIGLSLLIPGDKFRHVLNYEEFKNGNTNNKWTIGASDNRISVSRYAMNGKILNYWTAQDSTSTNNNSRPKCLPNAGIMQGAKNEVEWVKNGISDDAFYKTLDCLKDEMKPFNYWIVK